MGHSRATSEAAQAALRAGQAVPPSVFQLPQLPAPTVTIEKPEDPTPLPFGEIPWDVDQPAGSIRKGG